MLAPTPSNKPHLQVAHEVDGVGGRLALRVCGLEVVPDARRGLADPRDAAVEAREAGEQAPHPRLQPAQRGGLGRLLGGHVSCQPRHALAYLTRQTPLGYTLSTGTFFRLV